MTVSSMTGKQWMDTIKKYENETNPQIVSKMAVVKAVIDAEITHELETVAMDLETATYRVANRIVPVTFPVA